eukprot:gene330-biopygen6032
MELSGTQGITSLPHDSEDPSGLSGRPHPPAQFHSRDLSPVSSDLLLCLDAPAPPPRPDSDDEGIHQHTPTDPGAGGEQRWERCSFMVPFSCSDDDKQEC